MRRVWILVPGFSGLNNPLLWLLLPLVAGSYLLFDGIRSLIKNWPTPAEGKGDTLEDEPGGLLRVIVTWLIYGSVLLFGVIGGALVCIDNILSR
jgi:hypothetical protein